MNTADRSIALVDHALRRRFAFLALYPNFDILRKYHESTTFNPEGLIEKLVELNRDIGDPHYAVGVSYFLRQNIASEIQDIWKTEIEPYLEEYFFDQRDTVGKYRWDAVAEMILGA
jgi:5-methylcytosine-specific restriction protein B